MNRRRFPAWAMLIAIIAALTLLPATPAAAAPFDCKGAPPVSTPSRGGPASFGAKPALPPTGTDPFAAGSDTTIYREYGWPTMWWQTYDMGCGPDVLRNPTAAIGSYSAENIAAIGSVYATGFDALVHAVLDWQGLQAVDDSLVGVVDELRADLWQPIIGILLLAIALWFIVTIIRGDVSAVFRAAIFTLTGSFLLVILVNYPQKSSQVFDGAVKTAVAVAYSGTIPEADSGTEIADAIVGRVYQVTMYDRWCEGMVGGEDAGERWCPRLWKSLYMSRSETALPKEQKEKLIEQKNDDFETIAQEIKDQDASAYAVLTGENYHTRMYAAVASLVVWPLTALYPLLSLFLLLTSLMLARVAVILAPIFGPALIHPAARRIARPSIQVIGSALINAIIFGFSSAIFLRVEVAIMSATDMPLAVRLIVLAVLMVVFWVITKPWLHLTRLRPRKKDDTEPSAKNPSRTMKLVEAVAAARAADRTTRETTPTAPPPNAEAGTR